MVKRKHMVPVLLLFVIFRCNTLQAKEIEWENILLEISGTVLNVEGFEENGAIYIGTERGLYKMARPEGMPEKVDLPAGVSDIKDIAVAGEDVFIAASGSVFIREGRSFWRRLPGIGGIIGLEVLSRQGAEDILLAWTPEKIFRIENNTPVSIETHSMQEGIDAVAASGGVIFTASGRNVYCSSDGGSEWKRISLPVDSDGEGEDAEAVIDEETEYTPPAIRSIDASGPRGAVITTSKGIFVVGKDGFSPDRIDTTGLPSSDVIYAVNTEDGLFAATGKRVFLQTGSGKVKHWYSVFERTSPGAISFIKAHEDSEGRTRLFIAGGDYLYRGDVHSPADEVREKEAGGIKNREVSIRDVHRMAIEYAEVSPEKIRRWRTGARWKALMPRVSLGFSESIDDNVEIYKSATKSYIIAGPNEIDTDWGIDLTWDLSELVWNSSQTSIDVRSKLMVQLRDDILEEVTRLYFERKRLVDEIALLWSEKSEASDKRRLSEKMMKVEELTAYIDAFTGGKFSEALNARK